MDTRLSSMNDSALIRVEQLDDNNIVGYFQPFTTLFENKDEMFEITLPYTILVVNTKSFHSYIWAAKEPIAGSEDVIYSLGLPHVAKDGSICYFPREWLTEEDHASPEALILACMQAFCKGNNKYFLDDCLPLEIRQAIKNIYRDDKSVPAALAAWEKLTRTEVLNLQYVRIGTLGQLLKKAKSTRDYFDRRSYWEKFDAVRYSSPRSRKIRRH